MLTDAIGNELYVGDKVATLTGGQNAMVLVGTVMRLHDVKISVDITEARFVGEPESEYAVRRLPKFGDKRQLNAYRVFRLGPCAHEQREGTLKLKDLRFSVYRHAALGHPASVTVTHIPTGCTHTEVHDSELEAKSRALEVLEKIVAVHKGPQ